MDHSQHTMSQGADANLPVAHPKLKDYAPLFVVVAVILLGTLSVCSVIGFNAQNLLGYSMGFFFLIFGMFKVLDLGMFAMGYREYDLIAKRFAAWGYVYPFVELALAAAYLAGLNQPWLHIVTLVFSVLIIIGVAIKLAKHEVVLCVCLGNLLKVPLTHVSLVEYAAMGAMAAAMLLI